MKIKSFIAVAALVVSGFASNFVVAAPTTVNPSASFSATVAGNFVDTYAFQFLEPSIVAASLTNVEVSFGNLSFGGITNFQASLNNIPLLFSSSSQTNNGTAVKVQVLAGGGTFAAGTYNLVVSGNAGAGASYGGNIVAAPVPELESYAMLLMGLGLMGAIARRRIKSTSV